MRSFVESTQSEQELIQSLDSTPHGLTAALALDRLAKVGPNAINAHHVHWWQVLLRQLTSAFLFLLIAAAGLSFLLGERLDALIIVIYVVLNTSLGFYQEFHSEKTLALLKKYLVSHVQVIRDGVQIAVPSSELVPGDIVVLEAGDIVPADMRLLEMTNLSIDESVLTGESSAAEKSIAVLKTEPKEIIEADNLCFSGTTVVTGKARGLVLRTGKNTAIGEITKLTVETHHKSSFEKGIGKFSNFILKLILATLVGVFLINVVTRGSHINIPELLIFSIALAVTVIPEALPIVITFSLSRGALRLAKHKVVVKRLSAIEDLGSIEVLCTDKTGTLTENELTVHDTFGHKDVLLFAALGATIQAKKNTSIHSFDTALLDALQPKAREEYTLYHQMKELPFDPVTKRSSMVVERGKSYELIVRGAAEEIVKLCAISDQEKKKIKDWIQLESDHRIFAIAKKSLTAAQAGKSIDEKHLTFVGLISFVDPIKKTAFEAVKKAEVLGVKIKILTGDSREVAGSVAQQIGLISDRSQVLTGEEFDALPVDKQVSAIHDYSIFARVSPEQKYSIIKLLQEKYEVGFLGEGINDAPALKIANVALVVQGATDVARETADIILLKKSLAVIIDGIKEGRETFANTSKFIRAILASNFGNFYTVAIASLFITYLPLLPLQILLINLLTDSPMIAIATDSLDDAELRRPRSYGIAEIATLGTILGLVSSFFDFLFFLFFARISPQALQTNWFLGSVLTELVFLFSIRTHLPVWKSKMPSLSLILLSIIAGVIAIALPFLAFGHQIFGFITPTLTNIGVVFALVAIYFVSTEAVKLLYYGMVKDKVEPNPTGV